MKCWLFDKQQRHHIVLTWVLDFTKRVGENRRSHPWMEFGVAWTTVGIFAVRYVVDYLRLRRRTRALRKRPGTWWSHPSLSLVPLTRTRAELIDVTFSERWNRLQRALVTRSTTDDWKSWTDGEWIRTVHSSRQVRRELSYLMHGLVVDRVNERDLDLDCQALIQRIKTLWPRLLPFPDSLRRQHQQRDAFRISVIIPMFQESIDTMRETLNHALANCRGDAYQIQVIVVCADPDSSRPSTMKRLQTELHPSWGEFQVVALPAEQSGGGRGRTLNAGTPHSKAPVLTFLHADTLLPEGWDVTIEDALRMNETGVFVQACAFTMGIAMDGATASTTSGLRGAQWQGILRCHCGLPYGDSVLSFRKTTLEYLGGYPEQPLMEDFELMDWLRVRSMLLTGNDRKPTERLVLLDAQAKCSPRRWQKYGVAYTSLVNALCIYRYRYEGVMAEDLFSFYYHSANGGDSNCSKTLHSKKK